MSVGTGAGNWALVIGIDKYWSETSNLRGAVRDAHRMREWLLSSPNGGGVPPEQLIMMLAPAADAESSGQFVEATKDKIMIAINDLMTNSGGKGDRLYVFYAGHGLTARVANRDESAIIATDFNAVNTDNSIALRSLWEFFETTQFADQFFFVDACRNMPLETDHEFEIGRWTLPRSRDPGTPPVQQFILYATSPGLKTVEKDDYGNERGAFTDALLHGLAGDEFAKAWSWSSKCYEVRWERLVDFVKEKLEQEKLEVGDGQSSLFQIPQDAGSRGVADRDRDPVLASFPFAEKLRLEVELEPDEVYEIGSVRVLDGVGTVVAEVEARAGGRPVSFDLPPKTYALRAFAENFEDGITEQPIELYKPTSTKIPLQPRGGQPAEASVSSGASEATVEPDEAFGATQPPVPGTPPQPGRVTAASSDPLALVELRDATGAVVAGDLGALDREFPPGFYRLRIVTPEANGDDVPIALAPGEQERDKIPKAPALADEVRPLVEAAGGSIGADGTVTLGESGTPMAAPRRTTILTLAAAAAARGEPLGAWLDLTIPEPSTNPEAAYVVAVLDAGPHADEKAFHRLRIRLWPGAETIPAETLAPRYVGGGIATVVAPTKDRGPHWLSMEDGPEGETKGEPPLVFALTLLRDRPARPPLIVVHLERDKMGIFQYLISGKGADGAGQNQLRELEHAQRLLLSGRLPALEPLALRLAERAADDPLGGCLAGYTLLRLGHYEEVAKAADAVIAVAPDLADAYILRGEAAAAAGDAERSKQAFADAIQTGLPMFAEGLTKLVEGLRVSNFGHPRAAIVRYLFQRHLRGTMWSVFVPRPRGGTRELVADRLLITGADTGFEA